MNPKIGVYANEKENFVRPKQDVLGEPYPANLPLDRTRGIGGKYFVIIPLMNDDRETIDNAISELRAEVFVSNKSRKATKVAEETE